MYLTLRRPTFDHMVYLVGCVARFIVNFSMTVFFSFTGYPGGYNRIGGLRLDECAAYGCLLELTIQLGIIMVGKQVLNNAVELGVP